MAPPFEGEPRLAEEARDRLGRLQGRMAGGLEDINYDLVYYK